MLSCPAPAAVGVRACACARVRVQSVLLRGRLGGSRASWAGCHDQVGSTPPFKNKEREILRSDTLNSPQACAPGRAHDEFEVKLLG